MSSQMPSIPPRPARAGATTQKLDTPQVPPRPHRRSDQQELPNREAFTRSPLNDVPSGGLYAHSRNISASDLPDRPPSVNLPSIGQEGNEYASFEDLSRTISHPKEQTRSVPADLPMHQPTAAVPQSTAKTRIQTVTRTDSSQAAAAGVGESKHEDDKDHPLRLKASFNRSNQGLSGSSRPVSVHGGEEQEHGIPTFGLQIPLYKNAGDVQAPSPAPMGPPSSAVSGTLGPEVGNQRNHHRRRSSRQEFLPPGSYGLHGHGVVPQDKFEKAWYQKHPEELKKEIGRHYDPGHPESQWALSSEDLNKLVHQTSNHAVGDGAAADYAGTPDEQFGYKASEEYTTRMTSPTPVPLSALKPRPSSSSQPMAESPLRKSSFALEDEDGQAQGESLQAKAAKLAGEHGWADERSPGVPILASDEMAKRHRAEYLHAAVDPEEYHSGHESDRPSFHTTGRRSSGNRSRPTSTHGEPLQKLLSREAHDGSGVGTPLEEIQEYEPLFPDDDDKAAKPLTAADKLKRPDLARHHFPSRDIWEDNPDSLDLTTTVSTPQLPEEEKETADGEHNVSGQPSSTFEHPDTEATRKNGNIPSDRAQFLPQETREFAKQKFTPGVMTDMSSRPNLAQRFPSRDIWEDTPDSLNLQTTVDTPESEEITSPTDANSKPQIPSRPAGREVSGGADAGMPQIPARPGASNKQAPIIPDRPKPSVPARPGTREVQPEVTSPTETKTKPPVPSRPAGGKIASLKASFMNDLNSRLQLGPVAPKKEEAPEEAAPEEKAPLEDARKGRAKGPARRKPAAATTASTETAPGFSFSTPVTVFSLDEEGVLDVPAHKADSTSVSAPVATASPAASQSAPRAPEDVPAMSSSPAIEDESARQTGLTTEAIGFRGDTPDPHITSATVERHEAIAPLLSEALQTAEKETTLASTGSPLAHEAESASASANPTSSEAKDANPAVSQSGSGSMVDSGAQTGQLDITITSPKGEKDQMTTYLGGKAPEEGNVVVKNGEEILGEVGENTPKKIALTGHGM